MSTDWADGGRRSVSTWIVAALIATNLAAIWTLDYLPTHDGPQHIYTVHAAQRLGDPSAGYDRYLEAAHPITAHGFAVLFAPFDMWLPWQTAYRVALSLMLLLWISGSVSLARSLDPKRTWLGILLAGAGFQWSLYMGLFSFYIAVAFGLWVLAFAISRESLRPRDHAILGALLFVQALFHIFPALLTSAVVGMVGLSRVSARERMRTAAVSLLSMAPVLLIAVLLAIGSGEQAQYHSRADTDWQYTWPGLWILGKCMSGGPAWRAWTLTLLAGMSPLVAVAMFRDRLETRDRVLLMAGTGLLAAALALPLHLKGWDFFSLRFIPLAVVCLLVGFPLEAATARMRKAFSVAAALFAIASSVWALGYNQNLDQRSAPALAGLSQDLTRDGPRLPIVMDPYLGRPLDDREALMPFVVPLLNLGQLYATQQGGFAADTFAISPTTHQVLIRPDAEPYPAYPDRSYAIALAAAAPGDREELRRRIASYAASFGAGFEDVILYGTNDDADLLIARGFEVDFRAEGLMLAHFRGCSLSLEVNQASDAGRDTNTEIEMGWYPLLETSQRFVMSPSASSVFDLTGAPCGPVWLRVTSAADAAEGSAPRTCRGADAQGRLILPDSRNTPRVRCDLGTS